MAEYLPIIQIACTSAFRYFIEELTPAPMDKSEDMLKIEAMESRPLTNPLPLVGRLIEKHLPDGTRVVFRLGDPTGDELIDREDIEILEILSGDSYLGEFLRKNLTPEQLLACDINQDGVIDHQDIGLLYDYIITKLESLSFVDELTGLDNRRALKDKARVKIAASKRFNTPLSCLMIDIDRFKTINDTYGHDVGDVILKYSGQLLKKLCRLNDVVSRYGGEEFVVLLDQTEAEGALVVAEKIRSMVENETVTVGQHDIKFQISIGVSFLRKGMTFDTLIKEADIALYEAKRTGRNKVCVYTPTPPQALS